MRPTYQLNDRQVTALLTPPTMNDRVNFRAGGTAEIIETILKADRAAASNVRQLARSMETNDEMQTLLNVWHFTRNRIQYRSDRPGREQIKMPSRLWHEGRGDCKSKSLFIGACCRVLGIEYGYRFAAYRAGDFTHVYPVARIGGQIIIVDSVHTVFNQEVTFRNAKTIWMTENKIAGLSGISL